ncbi:MAG: High-affinity branched-chain amino acid transport system permease protein LivH [Pseudomonadota bacterium]|jgi:urea transport system permease protein
MPGATSKPLNCVMHLKRLFLSACLALSCAPLWALTQQQAQDIAIGDTDQRIAALHTALADPAERLLPYLKALASEAVKVKDGKTFMLIHQQVIDPVDGQSVVLPPEAEDVVLNNRLRGELDAAIATLQLFVPEPALRRLAIAALIKDPDVSKRPLIERALRQENSDDLKTRLLYALAAIDLNHAQAAERRVAAQRLGQFSSPDAQRLLNDQLQKETDPAVRTQLRASLQKLSAALAWGERLGIWFTGLSLGSVLLLVALGLAITYGLMGVINMAHGELMMIGAYATFLVQNLFKTHLPAWFDAYLVAAVPCAFLAAAMVGAVLERLVLRHLYGRPLETLLATWGISLILMQSVRSMFGAQNVAVENPAWMSGGLTVLSNLTLPWNRMLIIAFACTVLLGMTLLITRTRLGLFVRGVTQNRAMASCMGVNTARIDTYAFALGSGIAGLAGCALSQIGNVGPDLGQNYIVDAFMVVVLGGVGQLAGTVYAALGLGILNKLLEGWTGAVLAKIAVLILIVIFIQKRPQGLFALKGRSVEP